VKEAAQRVGVIGAGNIGGAIAANLAADGHWVAVYDSDPGRRERMVASGAVAFDSVADVAAEAEFTFTSLPTPQSMRTVSEEWLAASSAADVLIDLSTNAPATVREVGARLAEGGRHFLEAPLTGGAPGAQARQLVFMVGGEPAVFERCQPLLARLGRATFYIGALGLGNTAKLVNSLLAFTATWSSLEALAIAAKAGIDLRTMIDVVRTGGAGNFFTERMVEGINERSRPTMFSLALAAKDAGLAVDLAHDVGSPARVAEVIRSALTDAVDAGLGGRDFTDWVELIERQADVKLVLPPPKSG
jgi:3-hydroxyisobutyrate dehydrogenase-like beta-hydroxyacid dehydrogenase